MAFESESISLSLLTYHSRKRRGELNQTTSLSLLTYHSRKRRGEFNQTTFLKTTELVGPLLPRKATWGGGWAPPAYVEGIESQNPRRCPFPVQKEIPMGEEPKSKGKFLKRHTIFPGEKVITVGKEVKGSFSRSTPLSIVSTLNSCLTNQTYPAKWAH